MRDWARGGKVILDNANQHIHKLDAELMAFLARKPYSAVQETDPFTGDIHWVTHIEEEPDVLQWSVWANDAIHNLRVALDFLWYRVTGYTQRKGGGFPMFDTEDEFRKRFLNPNRPPKSLPRGTVDILVQLKPFRTDVGSFLWELFAFDNEGKHEALALVGHAALLTLDLLPGFITMQSGSGASLRFPSGMKVRKFPGIAMQEGTRLYTVTSAQKDKADLNPEFGFTVSLDDARIPPGIPISTLLFRFAQDVERAVELFTRAGLLR